MRDLADGEETRAFYDDLAADYDAIFADWDASLRWQGERIDALLAEAGVLPGAEILDATCGMGTQSLGLALRGYRVVGRDLSPAMIARACRERDRLGIPETAASFSPGDLRSADPRDGSRFAAVISFDNALPHLLTDEDLLAALRSLRRALRPGGVLLASIRDYDAIATDRPDLDAPRLLGLAPHRRLVTQIWTWAADGRSYRLDHLIVRETDAGWRSTSRHAHYRLLLRRDLDRLAARAGFGRLEWRMPDQSGFYQPILLARVGAAPGPDAAR